MLHFRWVFIETSLTLLCLLILVYSEVRLYHSLHDIQIQTKSISRRYLMVLLMAEILHHLPGMYYIIPVKKWDIYDINWWSYRISQRNQHYHFTMTLPSINIIVGRVSHSPNHQQLPGNSPLRPLRANLVGPQGLKFVEAPGDDQQGAEVHIG